MNTVVTSTRHKEPAIGGQGYVVWTKDNGDLADPPASFGIDNTHGPPAPVADIQMTVVRAQHARVWMLADSDGLFDRKRVWIDRPNFFIPFVANV